MSGGSTLLEVRDVAHRYGDHVALAGVTLRLAEGEVCGLLGRNGAGKSTLASVLAGLLRPDAGTVTLAGADVLAGDPQVRAQVGLASQELGLYQPLSARENLVTWGEMYGLRGAALHRRIDAVTEHFDLGHLLDRVVHRMSGGEQRRVHSAAAVLHQPRLVLLDEPTAGVDVQTRTMILDAVRAMAEHDGSAVLYATHYLAEVESLGATVAIIDGGTIRARGEIDELVRLHAEPALELRFSGRAPSLVGGVANGNLLRITGDRPLDRIPDVLRALGAVADDVVDIKVLASGLEGAYLAICGTSAMEAEA